MHSQRWSKKKKNKVKDINGDNEDDDDDDDVNVLYSLLISRIKDVIDALIRQRYYTLIMWLTGFSLKIILNYHF